MVELHCLVFGHVILDHKSPDVFPNILTNRSIDLQSLIAGGIPKDDALSLNETLL